MKREATDRIPLRSAYLCGDCRNITDGVPHGVCRLCGSSAVRAVAELLLSSDERQTWLDQVRGRIRKKLIQAAVLTPAAQIEVEALRAVTKTIDDISVSMAGRHERHSKDRA